MERLMELPVYQKNPLTRTYDKRMITKLIYNFRSHSKIIELPNKAFYDGDLVAKATSGNTFFSYFCTDRPFLRILN
jgi:helicase MOV-10